VTVTSFPPLSQIAAMHTVKCKPLFLNLGFCGLGGSPNSQGTPQGRYCEGNNLPFQDRWDEASPAALAKRAKIKTAAAVPPRKPHPPIRREADLRAERRCNRCGSMMA
jgi:hypothetical protein